MPELLTSKRHYGSVVGVGTDTEETTPDDTAETDDTRPARPEPTPPISAMDYMMRRIRGRRR